MNALRAARLEQIKREMGDLKAALMTSIADNPDDYDGREEMWMRREDLRDEKHQLELAKPSLAERISFSLFGRFPMPTVGASLMVICFFS